MWQIVLPAALPQILTGLQVALPISLIVAIVAEMAMGGYGLGGAMMSASRFADSRGVFAGIVEIAIVGYVLIKAMALIRRRLLGVAPGDRGAFVITRRLQCSLIRGSVRRVSALTSVSSATLNEPCSACRCRLWSDR